MLIYNSLHNYRVIVNLCSALLHDLIGFTDNTHSWRLTTIWCERVLMSVERDRMSAHVYTIYTYNAAVISLHC